MWSWLLIFWWWFLFKKHAGYKIYFPHPMKIELLMLKFWPSYVFILARTLLCLVTVLFSFHLKPFKYLFQGIWEFNIDIIKLRNFRFTSCWLYFRKYFIISHCTYICPALFAVRVKILQIWITLLQNRHFWIANHPVVDFCFSLCFVCCSWGSRLNFFNLVLSLPGEFEGFVLDDFELFSRILHNLNFPF